MKSVEVVKSPTTLDPPSEALPAQAVALHGTILRIEPSKGWASLRLRELWECHDLLYFLIWRDIKVRYKQTALGAMWAIIQPLFTMLIFSLFFGKLGKMPSDGVPYPLFSLTGLVPWMFFAGALSQASNSLVASANLIRKIYFPRLIIPLATVLAGTIDFFIAFVILLAMTVLYKVSLTIQVLWLIPLFLLSIVVSLGAGFWLSALNVQFRDVRHTVPFLVQIWLFATPIAYPSSLLPEKWRILYALNPMVGVVEGFRWAMLGTNVSPFPLLGVSAPVALGLMLSGMVYFRRVEKSFADLV